MASRIFRPTQSIHWYEFVIGTIVGGVLFGAGWQIGAKLVDKYVFHEHRHRHGHHRSLFSTMGDSLNHGLPSPVMHDDSGDDY